MGFVSSLLGTAGGQSGTGMNTLSPSQIINATTQAQATNAANNTQGGLQQQQALVNALAAQNGIGNQSSVFNQLQGVANGTGPNPAQAQLAQATGANTANQAALMAGQRGSGANAGLIARQAAQQGAANQQNSAGQAATLQANQSLGALNQLGGIAGQQVAQQQSAVTQNNQALQNEQQTLLNSIAQQNQTNAGLSGQQAGLANTQLQGQQGLLGGLTNAAGPALSSVTNTIGKLFADGGEVRKMYADPSDLVSVDYNNHDNVFPDGPSSQTPQVSINNAPVAAPAPSVPKIPTAQAQPAPQTAAPAQQNGPKSSLGQYLNNMNYGNPGANALAKGVGAGLTALFTSVPSQPTTQPQSTSQSVGANNLDSPGTQMPTNDDGTALAAHGGKVPALLSPGERYLPPKEVKEVVKGKKDPMKAGEKIHGKPKVGGAKNSYANDTVPKTLEEGGLVLPRSVTQAKHPHWEAHKFISAVMAKNGGKLPRK